MEKLLTAAEVAELTGISEPSLAAMRYRGNGPVYRNLGRRTIRYAPSDVERWIDASARTRTDQTALTA